MAQTAVYGVRETLAEIKQIDEKLYWESINQIKAAARPMADAVSAAFPSPVPMSGFANRGRLGYKAPAKVNVKFGGRKDKRSDEWGLVKIVIPGAAQEMIDMAQNAHNGEKTSPYKYKGGTRSHRVNGQGNKMIETLGGRASRYVWPTIEKYRPVVNAAILQAIADVSKIVNKNLVTRN